MKQRLKVLVTGASGLLGIRVVEKLSNDSNIEVIGISRSIIENTKTNVKCIIADLTDRSNLVDILNKTRPKIIIHCAANVDLIDCERNIEKAKLIHVDSTKTLSECKWIDRFVYISTDSIFDGNKGNYSENDIPNPLNVYAKTKLEGEGIALQQQSTIVIRTNIYGLNRVMKNSLAEWAIKNLSAEKRIFGYTDVIFNAVNTIQLSDAISKLILANYHGILNIGSDSNISKFQFLQQIALMLDKDKGIIEPTTIASTESLVRRPLNTSLDVSMLKRDFGLSYTFNDGLKMIENQLKKMTA